SSGQAASSSWRLRLWSASSRTRRRRFQPQVNSSSSSAPWQSQSVPAASSSMTWRGGGASGRGVGRGGRAAGGGAASREVDHFEQDVGPAGDGAAAAGRLGGGAGLLARVVQEQHGHAGGRQLVQGLEGGQDGGRVVFGRAGQEGCERIDDEQVEPGRMTEV